MSSKIIEIKYTTLVDLEIALKHSLGLIKLTGVFFACVGLEGVFGVIVGVFKKETVPLEKLKF